MTRIWMFILCDFFVFSYLYLLIRHRSKKSYFFGIKDYEMWVNGFLEYIEHRLEEVLQRLRRFLRSRNIELQLHLYITEMLFFHCLFDRVNCREFLSGFKSSSIYFRTLLHKINYSTFAVKNLWIILDLIGFFGYLIFTWHWKVS